MDKIHIILDSIFKQTLSKHNSSTTASSSSSISANALTSSIANSSDDIFFDMKSLNRAYLAIQPKSVLVNNKIHLNSTIVSTSGIAASRRNPNAIQKTTNTSSSTSFMSNSTATMTSLQLTASLTHLLENVFQSHGAVSFSPTLLLPIAKLTQVYSKEAVNHYVKYLDTRGNAFTLPHNLIAGYARYVALLHIENAKRYEVGRVFSRLGASGSGSRDKEGQIEGDTFQSLETAFDCIYTENTCLSTNTNMDDYLLMTSNHNNNQSTTIPLIGSSTGISTSTISTNRSLKTISSTSITSLKSSPGNTIIKALPSYQYQQQLSQQQLQSQSQTQLHQQQRNLQLESIMLKYNFAKADLNTNVDLLLTASDILTSYNHNNGDLNNNHVKSNTAVGGVLHELFQQTTLIRINYLEIYESLQIVLLSGYASQVPMSSSVIKGVVTKKVSTNIAYTTSETPIVIDINKKVDFVATASLEVNFRKLLLLLSDSLSLTYSLNIFQSFCETLNIDDKLKNRLLPFIKILGGCFQKQFTNNAADGSASNMTLDSINAAVTLIEHLELELTKCDVIIETNRQLIMAAQHKNKSSFHNTSLLPKPQTSISSQHHTQQTTIQGDKTKTSVNKKQQLYDQSGSLNLSHIGSGKQALIHSNAAIVSVRPSPLNVSATAATTATSSIPTSISPSQGSSNSNASTVELQRMCNIIQSLETYLKNLRTILKEFAQIQQHVCIHTGSDVHQSPIVYILDLGLSPSSSSPFSHKSGLYFIAEVLASSSSLSSSLSLSDNRQLSTKKAKEYQKLQQESYYHHRKNNTGIILEAGHYEEYIRKWNPHYLSHSSSSSTSTHNNRQFIACGLRVKIDNMVNIIIKANIKQHSERDKEKGKIKEKDISTNYSCIHSVIDWIEKPDILVLEKLPFDFYQQHLSQNIISVSGDSSHIQHNHHQQQKFGACLSIALSILRLQNNMVAVDNIHQLQGAGTDITSADILINQSHSYQANNISYYYSSPSLLPTLFTETNAIQFCRQYGIKYLVLIDSVASQSLAVSSSSLLHSIASNNSQTTEPHVLDRHVVLIHTSSSSELLNRQQDALLRNLSSVIQQTHNLQYHSSSSHDGDHSPSSCSSNNINNNTNRNIVNKPNKKLSKQNMSSTQLQQQQQQHSFSSAQEVIAVYIDSKMQLKDIRGTTLTSRDKKVLLAGNLVYRDKIMINFKRRVLSYFHTYANPRKAILSVKVESTGSHAIINKEATFAAASAITLSSSASTTTTSSSTQKYSVNYKSRAYVVGSSETSNSNGGSINSNTINGVVYVESIVFAIDATFTCLRELCTVIMSLSLSSQQTQDDTVSNTDNPSSHSHHASNSDSINVNSSSSNNSPFSNLKRFLHSLGSNDSSSTLKKDVKILLSELTVASSSTSSSSSGAIVLSSITGAEIPSLVKVYLYSTVDDIFDTLMYDPVMLSRFMHSEKF